MTLPSKEILDDIRQLVTEITGFQEKDENFAICERYCLSHVVHHSYPFVNRTTVKTLINSFVSRFYGHGYFKVSQELNSQVQKFLENEKLFEKNPQYDIQWCLLSLLSSLSSNLTTVRNIPSLLPVDTEEDKVDKINWSEYLMQDLQGQSSSCAPSKLNDSLSTESEDDCDDDAVYCDQEAGVTTKNFETSSNQKAFQVEGNIDIKSSDKTLYENEKASILRRNRLLELINSQRCATDIENDFKLRGNISEKFDRLLINEGIHRHSQLLSECEIIKYILYQFQTGDNILLKKGLISPALTSLTQYTLGSYLESLQLYFKIIRCFKEFFREIKVAKYPAITFQKASFEKIGNNSIRSTAMIAKPKIPNVLYAYSLMLNRALEPFQNEVLEIFDNLGSYSLLQMHQKIEPYFFELNALYNIHVSATKNWKNESNWICSVRVLGVLYNAIMSATTPKMSFMYLNFFLHCFEVYLDIIDSWITFLNLNDPNDEFIITKSESNVICHNYCEFEVRPYNKELQNAGIKPVPVLDFIAEKMLHAGQSLEVLRRLSRFVTDEAAPQVSSYRKLLGFVNAKLDIFGKVPTPQIERNIKERKRSIFTMANVNLLLNRDDGDGDCSAIGNLLENLKEEKIVKLAIAPEVLEETRPSGNQCMDFIYSTINNSFFKKAFQNIGVENELKKLEKTRTRVSGEGEFELLVLKSGNSEKIGVYPYCKIISESCHQILGNRIDKTCILVKNIVLKECHLETHFSLLKSILLFGDSYLIQPFIHVFFTQPSVWESSYSLTLHLKECVEARYKLSSAALSVSVAKDSLVTSKDILFAIDAITVNYEVNWPLTLILTQDVMKKYNTLFRLALKLKWVHWTLSNLHFQDKNDASALLKSTFHRLQLLRFWFLSTLNRLNNYFVAQVGARDLDLNACDDLKDLINVHSDFIETTYYHCKVKDKAAKMWDLVFQTLFPLCEELVAFWTRKSIIAKSKLSTMEVVFARCQLQLSHLISSLEKN